MCYMIGWGEKWFHFFCTFANPDLVLFYSTITGNESQEAYTESWFQNNCWLFILANTDIRVNWRCLIILGYDTIS